MSCGNPAFYYVEKGFNWVERETRCGSTITRGNHVDTALRTSSGRFWQAASSARTIRRSKRTTPGGYVWPKKTTHGWHLLAGERSRDLPPFLDPFQKTCVRRFFFGRKRRPLDLPAGSDNNGPQPQAAAFSLIY